MRGQRVERARDVGFAVVQFDNGGTYAATSINESFRLDRPTGSLFANGLASAFQDGRWSLQGMLGGSRISAALPTSGRLAKFARTIRGELGLVATSTAQQGFMPTLQLTGQAKLHFQAEDGAARLGAMIARTFDGVGWRTTVIGEAGGWWQVREHSVVSLTSTPMQLQFGDLLGDHEVSWSETRGRWQYDFSLGGRFGEAARSTVFWGSASVAWPVYRDLYMTASAGNYPVDLIQGLPGGRYMALALRLPEGRWPRKPPAPVSAPKPLIPPRLVLPTSEPLALVIGPPLDSLEIREIRVWAPGVRRVELLADFVDWIPVPLIRQPNGEWQGYYYVRAGMHRLNLRLDGREIAVPRNLPAVEDEFNGRVAIIVVRP